MRGEQTHIRHSIYVPCPRSLLMVRGKVLKPVFLQAGIKSRERRFLHRGQVSMSLAPLTIYKFIPKAWKKRRTKGREKRGRRGER